MLVLGPKARDIPETMVCRILTFMGPPRLKVAQAPPSWIPKPRLGEPNATRSHTPPTPTQRRLDDVLSGAQLIRAILYKYHIPHTICQILSTIHPNTIYRTPNIEKPDVSSESGAYRCLEGVHTT